MPLLAIETCLGSLSVAVARAEDGYALALREEPVSAAHAELLMPAVRDAMAEAGCRFADLRRVAITLGPGSFTGVRTGIAAARGFALGTAIEIVGVGSLALVAHMAARTGGSSIETILATMDARRGRVYAQLFSAGTLTPLTEPGEFAPEDAAQLATSHGDAVVAGSGADLVAEAHRGARALRIARGSEKPALALAQLAPSLTPLQDIAPVYIRPPDAKPPSSASIARTT